MRLRFYGERTPPPALRAGPSPFRGGIRKRARKIARILYRPRVGRSSLPPASKKYRGRAGRQGSETDPAGLDASRHRGLSKSALLRAYALRRVLPQVRQTQGVPRAVFLRFAPRSPRQSGDYGLCTLTAVEDQALGPEISDKSPAVPAVRALDANVDRAGRFAAWTAGPWCRISDTKSFPGHRSPPRVWRR